MAGAESAGETGDRARGVPASRSGGRPGPEPGGQPVDQRGGHAVVAFLRANPQVFVLLVICLVLGIGTFLAVVFGLLTAGSGQTTGEPSGLILGAHTVLGAGRSLAP